MTFDLLKLFFGVLGLTLLAFYAWWAKVRVVLFRERLFLIRDQLWNEARKLGSLDDPAHRSLRQVLNSTIRAADLISVPSLILCHRRSAATASSNPIPPAQTAAMQSVVDASLKKMVAAIIVYIICWQASGPFAIASLAVGHVWKRLGVRNRSLRKRVVETYVDSWIRSAGPEQFSDAEEVVKSFDRRRRLVGA